MNAVWREPAEETIGLYPGLVMHDGRVNGSITVGRSRLPLWAICATAISGSWQEVEEDWPTVKDYGFGEEDFVEFIYCLMEMRGEFGRLLLVLADAERRWRAHDHLRDDRAWWEMPTVRTRILKQLRRCVASLEAVEPRKPYSHWRRIGPGVSSYDFEAAAATEQGGA